MEFDQQRINRLIARTLFEELSEEDSSYLKAWIEESPAHGELCKQMASPDFLPYRMSTVGKIDPEERLKINLQMLRGRRKRMLLRRWTSVAAAIVVIVGVGILWMIRDEGAGKMSNVTVVQDVIPSGKQKAELILANGGKMMLDEQSNTSLQESGMEIEITGNRVNYRGVSGDSEMVYNTIRTPRGGEYSLTLSDGTRVWLNAASELVYPVAFSGETREVVLKGEGYFEVSPDAKKRFVVHVGEFAVEVLGTVFDVKAYPEEGVMQTTLCSGRVVVKDSSRSQKVELLPGKQVVCDLKTREMVVRAVNTDLYTAWTTGRFSFDNASIEEIFNVLGRWYNIDVFYVNQGVRGEMFTGDLPRFDDLQTLLKLIESVSNVHFVVKGNTIMIE